MIHNLRLISNTGSTNTPTEPKKEKSQVEFETAVKLAAAANGVRVAEICSRSRSRAQVAHARQIAMYLLHVGLGRTAQDTAHMFHRDRSTVSYACARIEDLRDRNDFDHALTCMEHVLLFAMDDDNPQHVRLSS